MAPSAAGQAGEVILIDALDDDRVENDRVVGEDIDVNGGAIGVVGLLASTVVVLTNCYCHKATSLGH